MTTENAPLVRRALAAVLVALCLFVAVRGLAHALPGASLMDFGSFFASGEAAARGDDPYGVYPLTFRVTLPGFESANPNLNPPISLPAFELFARLDPVDGFRLWWAISFAAYAALVWLLVRAYARDRPLPAAAWAFALAGFWDTLVLGQIYVPLALAAAGAWLLLARGRVIAAGLLIGAVVAVKPNFLVWPGLLFLAGYYRPAFAAAASAATLTAIPLLLYGPEVYGQWIALVLNDAARARFLTNASLSGIAQRLGSPALGTVLSVALLAGLAIWTWRTRPPALLVSALGLLGALLASPIAWVHYTLFLLPVFFVLPLSAPMLLAAAALIVPVPFVLGYLDAPAWQQATVGSLYGWAVVLCLHAVMRARAAPVWLDAHGMAKLRHAAPYGKVALAESKTKIAAADK